MFLKTSFAPENNNFLKNLFQPSETEIDLQINWITDMFTVESFLLQEMYTLYVPMSPE